LTFLGDISLIQEKKQPVPPTRGMDSTGCINMVGLNLLCPVAMPVAYAR
jgi:hypothetical protein